MRHRERDTHRRMGKYEGDSTVGEEREGETMCPGC